MEKKKYKKELLELAKSSVLTKNIETILFHKAFPVDIRHNSKIFREKLAIWAKKLKGNSDEADYWINKLSPKHQEGGFYRRIYSSDELPEQNALPNRFTSPRLISTAIYYLLKWDQVSLLHRLKSDELWHFYTGNPLTIHIINQQKQFDKERGRNNFPK